MPAHTVLVISNPAARHLRHLDRLPAETRIVVGRTAEALENAAPDADVIMVGNSEGNILKEIWPLAKSVRWIHCIYAGLETTLFPELVDSPVPLTNARGVYARSLGEWSVAAMLFFAKDLRRLVKQQEEGRWEQFDVEELHDRSLAIVGYGQIGRAAASRAKAFGMKILVLRRRAQLAASDPLVDRVFEAGQLHEMLSGADYVLVAAPNTPETRGLIDSAALEAMKSTAVLINVGRGPVVVEQALIDALVRNRIRGAALDVFDTEPLPEGHLFYKLPNVLLSPHSADHTASWLDETMELFLENYTRFAAGEPLKNVVDKRSGY